MQSPQPMQYYTFIITNIHRLQIAGDISHNVFLTTSFSHCLSHNVFLTTSSYQCLSKNVTLLPLRIRPHNVVLTKPWYTYNLCLCSYPRYFDIFLSIKLKPRRCTFAYIFFHCVKFQNPRTEVSCQSVADKVLYKYPKLSQIRLSSDPRNS